MQRATRFAKVDRFARKERHKKYLHSMTELPPVIPPPGALPRMTPRDRLNGTPAPGVTLGARAEALRGEHESAAAVKVQAMARGRNARKYQVQENSAAAELQAVQRGKSARNGVRDYES